MLTPLMDIQSGIDFSELVEGDEFTWNQFHIEVWGEQDFEGHVPEAIQKVNGWAVPLTCILLDSQSMVHLIANPKILVNIKKVQGKDTIWVHCNSGVKIMDRVGDIPGYGTIWYEPIGIANIIFMSRATKKFRIVFDSEGKNIFRTVLLDR